MVNEVLGFLEHIEEIIEVRLNLIEKELNKLQICKMNHQVKLRKQYLLGCKYELKRFLEIYRLNEDEFKDELIGDIEADL